MYLLCKAFTATSDIRCAVCGQGFHVHWLQTPASEREQAHDHIHQTLAAAHHQTTVSRAAHPKVSFPVAGLYEASTPALTAERTPV